MHVCIGESVCACVYAWCVLFPRFVWHCVWVVLCSVCMCLCFIHVCQCVHEWHYLCVAGACVAVLLVFWISCMCSAFLDVFLLHSQPNLIDRTLKEPLSPVCLCWTKQCLVIHWWQPFKQSWWIARECCLCGLAATAEYVDTVICASLIDVF